MLKKPLIGCIPFAIGAALGIAVAAFRRKLQKKRMEAAFAFSVRGREPARNVSPIGTAAPDLDGRRADG